MKKYNPKRCQRVLVAQIEDKLGNRVALFKHHAFEWTVIKEIDGTLKAVCLPREKAKAEYKKLKKLIV